ncbi:MAG: GNAT family N-acetyltransferase [Limisphaerales bacterium]
MKSDFENILLRPETPDDAGVLFEIYASTRQDEMDLTGWDADKRANFLDMQFKAMRQSYRVMFPTAQFSIVVHEMKTIGRIVVDRRDEEIHVVDLALLPEFRNQKIGTFLMQRICHEATQANKTVTLSVFKKSEAIHWYHRLGFSTMDESGFYEKMEWRPSPVRAL